MRKLSKVQVSEAVILYQGGLSLDNLAHNYGVTSDDYKKPLFVRWLCQKHHHEWHKNNKAIKNEEN